MSEETLPAETEEEEEPRQVPLNFYEERLSDSERAYIEEYLRTGGDHGMANVAAGWRKARPRANLSWICREVLRQRVAALTASDRLNTDRIIAELQAIGFSNITDFLKNEHEIGDLRKLPAEVTSAIASFEEYVDENGNRRKKIKLHPKLQALNKMITLLKLEPPKRVEVTGKDGEPIQIEDKRRAVLDRLQDVIDLKQGKDGSYE